MTFTEVLHQYFDWVSAHLPENQLIRFVFHVSIVIFIAPVVLYLLVLLLFTSVGILAFLSIFVVVSGATTVAFIPVLAITLAASLLSAFVVSIIYLGYTGFTAEEGWVRRLLAPLADLLPPSVGVSEVVKKNGSAKVATVTEIDPDDERLEGVSNDKVSEQQNSEAVS
ncbi:Hypothetical protein KP2612_000259 [Komagataella phaffii]